MPRIRTFITLLALIAALAIAAACSDDDNAAVTTAAAPAATTRGAPDHIVFMPGFKPQANLPFVGAYVAAEKGFFADENLDVEIRHVTTPGDNYKLLATGEVQFTTADASELLARWTQDTPIPIVSVALIGQKGQQGFAVLADSGIQSPKDWAGKRTGYKGAQVTPDYLAILEANGVDRSAVSEAKVGFAPQVLTEGSVDIYPVFLSNEPDTLKRLGYETKVFEAADYGAPTLGLTYAATQDYLAENPGIAARFVTAVLKGIQYADTHREEAVQIVLKYAPQEDPAHQRFMMDTELAAAKLGEAKTKGIGSQTQAQWQDLADFLVKYGGLPKAVPDITKVFTNEYVQKAYASGQLQQ